MVSDGQRDSFEVVACGVDWLTCTGKNGIASWELERIADVEISVARQEHLPMRAQNRIGFEGTALEHLFFGRREHDVMLQASGPDADRIAMLAVPHASNVSRIDLQVTVFTEGNEVELASAAWDRLKTLPNGRGRPRSFSLIVNHPVGQTLYIGSRSSDNFGRIYDKGVESRMGPAGLLWRYEVELKRDRAQRTSAEYVRSERPTEYAIGQVHHWMTERGVVPHFPSEWAGADPRGLTPPDSRDVLRWFNESVSITVQRAIRRHGLSAVLASLGLLKHVRPLEV